MMGIFLSVIIPVYNEERRIRKTLTEILSYLKRNRYSYEIIIVNDGSADDTLGVIKSMRIKGLEIIENEKNRGKGFSVRRGLLYSKGKYALFSDADMSTPIAELGKLMKFVPQYDIVIGSRKKEESKVVEKQVPWRVFAGNLFPVFVHLIIPLGINDTQCGFKLFDMRKSRKIIQRQTLMGFCFDVELMYIAKISGLKIKEVGVDWYNDRDTKVNLIKDSVSMIYDLIKIRVNALKGHYGR